jgi:hypothetical protein
LGKDSIRTLITTNLAGGAGSRVTASGLRDVINPVVNLLPVIGGYRIAFIGDSLVHQAHTFGWSGGAGAVTTTLQTGSVSSRSWLSWLEFLSKGAIRVPAWSDTTEYDAIWAESGVTLRGFWGMNFGINGSTSDEILDRLDGTATPSILDLDFDIAFLEGGTNDISAAIAPDTTVTDMLASLDLLLNAGKFVVFLPIRSRGTSSWSTGSNNRKKARYINQRLRHAVAARPNCIFVDWDRAWSDSTTTDGEPITGYSDDAVHDTPIGGYNIAKYIWFGMIGATQVWAGLQSFFPLQEDLYTVREDVYDATHNTYGNLHHNGMFVGTGGTANSSAGATGTVADSLTLERSSGSGSTTVVGSKETSTDNSGFKQVLTFTNGGSSSETFFLRGSTSTVSATGLGGKWFQGSVDIEVTSAYDKIACIDCYVNDVVPNITYRGMATYSTLFWPNETFSGRAFTPAFMLGNTGTLQMRPRVNVVLTGGGTGNPVIKISKFALRQIDDPRDAYGWDGPTYGEA